MESGSQTTDDAGAETTDRPDESDRSADADHSEARDHSRDPARSGDDRPDRALDADAVDAAELRCGISLGDPSEDESSDSPGDARDESPGE
ncbi:hypothetical protein [Halosimplex sp. J119]